MKKSLIAAAGTTLAVAALPAVGVFASSQFTDTVQVNVVKSCIFKAEWDDGQGDSGSTTELTGRTFSKNNVAPGTLLHFGGNNSDGPDGGSSTSPRIKMECNDGDGTTGQATSGTWSVSAKGGQAGTGNENKMMPTGTGTAIATGTLDSGATSNWAFKISAPASGVTSGYTTWHAIPNADTVIVTGVADASGQDVTFTPEYQVYIGTDQEADTYTGMVVYTLTATFGN